MSSLGWAHGGVRGAELPESERRLPFLPSLQVGGREAPERAKVGGMGKGRLGGTAELPGDQGASCLVPLACSRGCAGP